MSSPHPVHSAERDLAILADDLTGALDSGAAFASPQAPVEAQWDRFLGRRAAYDTETRDAHAPAARHAIRERLSDLERSTLALKKLDSLLRGNSFIELATCCQESRFEAIYIAPAFPAQGRVTEGGVQLQMTEAGCQQLTPPIAERLAADGIAVTTARSASDLPCSGVAVCDAMTDADLRDLVAAGSANGGRILWCGSAGLAAALAGEAASTVTHAVDLVVVGSQHPVTRRHLADLSEALGDAVIRVRSVEDAARAVAAAADAIQRCGRAVLALAMPPLSHEAAERCSRDVFTRLVDAMPPPAGLVVVGGDTLFRLMQAVGAVSLSVIGQRAPGLPVSRIVGGLWDGLMLTSKSGAFDDAGLFKTIMAGDENRA